ncbi:MAG: hypothetical protein COA86_15345 [Kangiella sp.]|nr:MAG: hypothetical protein COA86_15345 [Kangiella sp.]
MKLRSIVTATMMACTFGAGAVTVTSPGIYAGKSFELEQVTKSIKKKPDFIKIIKNNTAVQSEYLNNKQHDGYKRYIIRLTDKPVTTYKGGIAGLDAVNTTSKKGNLDGVKFNAKSAEAKQYLSYLDKQQNTFIQKATTLTGSSISSLRSLKYAINGLVVELTFNEAQKISRMPEVAFVEQDELVQLETDTGPALIGAGSVWDGTATGTEYRGEGTIIGVIDTGVNTDHRSFAATGDDGYTVVNPYGEGVFVGDCVADASLCNSKLIGVRSYSAVTDVYSDPIFDGDTRPANGEDYNGHGSHTSSTAGGNVLLDVPLTSNDGSGANTGDGTESAFTFASMSGVAPHANIISYQICLPGNRGDTYSGCYSAAGIGAIDDAISDGVDVINYSIGGTTNFSPWTSSTEIGFLNARAAGIFVAVSAGNSGPGPETSTKVAPWYTSVAASTHGRSVGPGVLFDGAPFLFTASQGPAVPAVVTAPVVYAGDVDAANFEGCLAFAADSFTDSIALISRGACAFADKVNNAADAGADLVIVFNSRDGDATFIMGGTAGTPIPSVMVSQNSGASMVASLAATPGLTATFDASDAASFVLTFGQQDSIASFSSRGRNRFVDIITPQIAAPGVNVYAAYADEQPFLDVSATNPADFGFLSGTSMASPHIAGSAALVKQAHPNWNPDQIRSALMMTATTAMTKEDGVTAADYFDMGAGRVQVNLAVNAGLVMSENVSNYEAADPALGGDPRTLNRPSMADFACSQVCTWTRTFTATTTGVYQLSSTTDLMAISPATIDAEVGSSYTVNFALVAALKETGDEMFEAITITSDGTPDLRMPVYAKINNGAVPDAVTMNVGQNSGTYTVKGIQSTSTDALTVVLNGMFDAGATGSLETFNFELDLDPTNGDYADDFSQVFVDTFEVVNNTATINVTITETTSPDLDMFLDLDSDGDGIFETAVANSATGATLESITINSPAPGTYRLVIQNWAASAGGTDTVTYIREVVPVTDPIQMITVVAPTSANGLDPIDIKFLWDFDLSVGDSYFGDITVSAGSVVLGNFPLILNRVEDDVSIVTDVEMVTRGDMIDYTLHVNRNLYNDDMDYSISVDLSAGTSLVADSVVASGGSVTVKDPNAVGLDINEEFVLAQDPTNGDPRNDVQQIIDFTVDKGTVVLNIAIIATTSPDLDIFLDYDADGDGVYETAVANSATAATLETIDVSAPVEGAYRLYVQNWASGATGEDPVTVTIKTTPAKGEGFLFSVTSTQQDLKYVAVSSVDVEECANAGFGGYLPLEIFGIGTLGINGDTFSEKAFEEWVFPHYGEQEFGSRAPGLSITDDGFIFFSGTSGGSPWAQTEFPNSAAPNDMVALAWQDMDIFDDRDLEDPASIGTRGIRTARVSSAGMAIIEYDTQALWGNPFPITSISHEIFAFNSISDDHNGWGKYEYIVAYAEEQTFLFGYGPTAGIENKNGTVATSTTGLIQAGTQVCYDFVRGDDYTVTFSVSTSGETLGNPISPTVTVETDMANAKEFSLSAPVGLVNVAPIASAGPDATYNRSESGAQIRLTAGGTVDVDQSTLLFTWTQIAGTDVNISGHSAIHAFFDTNSAPNGTYTFRVDVSDGEFSSSDEVTITMEGTDASAGSGSLGFMLLLLSIPLVFRRKHLK